MSTDSPEKDQDEAQLQELSPEQRRELLEQLLREKLERAADSKPPSESTKPPTARKSTTPAAPQARQVKEFPMSAGQAGLWHAFRRDPSLTPFNVFLPTRVRSKLDLSALQRSIEFIADRHESLRTTFASVDGELIQRVHPELSPEFRVVDLSHIQASQNPEAAARELLHKQMRRPFDLETGPLLRLFVAKLNPTDHVILAATHHIVTDFWSLILTLQELRAVYPQIAQGSTPQLPPASNAFQHFVTEQKQMLNGLPGRKLREHWTQTLSGASSVVELPTDFFRPASFSHRAGTTPIDFPALLSNKVKRFATNNRTTTFSVLQAALQVLIFRYGGQEQFFIGTPFSGRTRQRYEQTLGFFVNMLPVKADLSDKPCFKDLLKRTSNTLLDCLENEAYPVADIVHDARIERDPSRSPLFQVSCTFEKAHLKEEVGRGGFLFEGETQSWDFGGLKQESFFMPHQTCHYDLEFIFEESAGHQLRGMLCYCRDLFKAESAEQIVANYVALLEQLIDHPETQVTEVAWPVGEQPLSRFDVTAPADDRRIDELFAQAASQSPEQPAIVFEDHKLTYAEFASAAATLAKSLPGQASGESGLVPILTARSPLQWIAQWACHLTGRAFIPVDESQPSIAIDELLSQSQAAFVLCDRASRTQLTSQNVPTIVIEDELAALGTPEGRAAAMRNWDALREGSANRSAEELAYVVYTSGSTGKPKGVMLPHAAVANTLDWRREAVPLETTDRVLIPLSHQFDAGIGLAWTTLTQSATLVIATEHHLRDPDSLLDLMIQERITVLPAPPSLLQMILKHPRFPECAANLKYVWTGGEAMPADLPNLVRSLTSARFFNFYGPTEAAIEATYCELESHDPDCPVPIGEAIPNTCVFILDSHGNPLPPTVPGEIAIGGNGLALGYLNAPELTSEKFVRIETPAGTQRVYRTGDRGRFNSSGQIEFLGRLDHQVKLRGYRIELGEIETLMAQDPDVNRSAVVVHRQDSAHAALVGFVSLHAKSIHAEPSLLHSKGTAIRRALSDCLPSYKTPASVVVIDNMPLTTSGKVDRKRLLEEVDASRIQREVIPPSSPLEEFLESRWKQHLDCESVSVDINFFDAGGSSLQAAILTSEVGEELGVRVPTSLIFDLATIRQMADRLASLHPEEIRSKFGSECLEQHQQSENSDSLVAASESLVANFLEPADPTPVGSATRTKIFMIHPPGGIVVCYRELAQQLNAHSQGEFELIGIRSRGLHGAEQLPESMEQMAADYIDAIRSQQEHGPYEIGGWSVGGLVAYEVAQQLIASGQQVRLTFLDTTIPAQATQTVPASETVDVGREYGIDMSLDQLGELAPEEQLPFLWDHAKKLGVLDDDSDPAVVAQALEDLQNLFHHHISLATEYKMLPIAAPLHLIRPLEMPVEIQVSEDRGWKHLCMGGVQVDFVPGHHHSMVQPPNVEELAKAMLARSP